MTGHAALLAELDAAFTVGGADRQTVMAQKIADLFVLGASSYPDDQIAIFDDVFTYLVPRIATSARASLSARMSVIPRAPPSLSRVLAHDDAIAVAEPMLRHGTRLDNPTLVGLARNKSQEHLLAISLRRHVDRAVTDVLVDRGDRSVVLSTARNKGAAFSDFGFSTLIARAKDDDELAAYVGARRELPRHYLLKLLVQASEAVRRKLEQVDPLNGDAFRAAAVETVWSAPIMIDRMPLEYAAAQARVDDLRAAGRLNESAIADFAKELKTAETTIALARLSDLPVEAIELAMAGERPETILIIARAIGFSWATVKVLLAARKSGQGVSAQMLENCLGTFSRMKPATARQVLAFQRKRSWQRPQIV